MKLKEGHYYHIYNRGINSRLINRKTGDYQRFLQSYFYYCFLVLETYAYCLLNNHFHYLVRVRTQSEQERLFYYHRQQDTKQHHGLKFSKFKPQHASTQLGHLFNSYTRTVNNEYKTTGPLFEGRFKRIEIDNRAYRAQLVCYIHRNPIHHQLVKNYEDYRWSSYPGFLNGKKTKIINYEEVLHWFGDAEGFKAAHDEIKLKLNPEYLLE